MSSKKSRINIAFDDETIKFFALLARQENKSVPNVIRELALEALAIRDNGYLSKMTRDLDVQNSKSYHSEF